ncbi:MAG: Gfo/Idh/MocA family oxidoreductase [Actinomycetota bacterium]
MGMRFGVVGTGFWARETHAAALAAHPDADLVGVWGRSFARAAELAETVGAQAFERADDMFADVDAVAFAVPPDVQADLAVRAATHGCHLLLDKPLAFTTDDADRVVEAVDRAGVRSLVFFTSRFTANQAAWLAEVQQTSDWSSANVRMYGSIFEPGNPFGESAWRRTRGALWDIGPHALSILVPALGPVTHVIADRGLGDTVTVVLHHESGAASTMSLSLTAPPGSRGTSWQLFGTERQTSMPDATTSALEAMGACVTQLLTDQPGRWQHPCDVHFGRDVVEVLQAADEFLARPLDDRVSGTSW